MYMGCNKINNKITSELEKLHNVKNYNDLKLYIT